MADHPEQGGTLDLSHLSGGGGLKGLQKGCHQRGVSLLWLTPSLSKVHATSICQMPVICQVLF